MTTRTRAAVADVAVPAAALLVAAALYLWQAGLDDLRWVGWADQGRYLAAVQAWRGANLDPGQHWYPPGYAMLGAAFAGLTPRQPFLLPDLLCLLASLVLFTRLAQALWPDRRGVGAAASVIFVLTSLAPASLLQTWVMPWTTTATVPLMYAATLAAVRFLHGPSPAAAFAAGIAATGLGMFRPTEAMVVLAVVPVFMAGALGFGDLRRGVAWRCIGAGCLGAAVPAVVFLVVHHAIFGWALSPYMRGSAQVGFEWRLIAQNWVTLFIGATPLLDTGQGMMTAFAWVMPGVAGLAGCVVVARPKAPHLLVMALILLHCLLYLAYRDLHPQGLWRFENVHYFKPVLPLLGLYAGWLAVALCRRRTPWRVVAAACAVAVALVPWRADLDMAHAGPVAGAMVLSDRRLLLPDGLPPMGAAMLVGASGSFDSIYSGLHGFRLDGRLYETNIDFKAEPIMGGFILTALRPLPHQAVTLVFGEDVGLRDDTPVRVVPVSVTYALPCWAAAGPFETEACRPSPRFAAAAWPEGKAVSFAGPAAPYLMGGWSKAEEGGRWTDGPRAGLYLLPGGAAGDVRLTLSAHAYVLDAGHPVRVTVLAGAERVAGWVDTDAAPHDHAIDIPARLRGADGAVRITLVLELPDRVAAPDAPPDDRRLGLFVERAVLDAVR